MSITSWNTARWWIIALGIVYILIHFFPYLDPMVIPSSDYANLGTTFSYLQNPANFQGEGIVSSVYANLQRASYLYYFIGDQLTALLEPLQIPKVYGLVFGIATFLLAGGRWNDWTDGLKAVLITVVFIHLTGSVNPMVGNKRSITLPVLLFAVHPWSQNMVARLFVLALACAVYPQAGLLFMGYYLMRFLTSHQPFPTDQSLPERVGNLATHGLIFMLALSPMVYDTFISSGSSMAHDMAAPLLERWESGSRSLWDSWKGLYLITIAGARSAFFRIPSTIVSWAVFTVLSLGGYLLVKRYKWDTFTIKNTTKHLIATGFVLWFLAHLTHPLIHHPFKYTRVTFLLGAMLVFTNNLSAITQSLYHLLTRSSILRNSSAILSVIAVLGFTFSLWWFPGVWTRGNTSIHVFWPGIVTGLIIFGTGLSFVRPRPITVYGLCLLMVGLFFYPHSFGHYSKHQSKYRHLTDYHGVYDTIRSLPATTTIAGPPAYMDWIPVFGRREIYFNKNRRSIATVCQRIKQFRKVYFAQSPSLIKDYLFQHPIDYVLIDRAMFRGKPFSGCRGSERVVSRNFVLDRTFPDARWTHGNRFYLVSRETLLQDINQSD